MKRVRAAWQTLAAWGGRYQNLTFVLGLGLAAALIAGGTLLPLSQRTAGLRAREAELDRQLEQRQLEKEELTHLVEALESDPFTIEMHMRTVLRKRRPDEQPLSEWLETRQQP